VKLSGEVECDEVYIVSGHKGRPDVVAKLGRLGRRPRLKGAPGRGTLAGEKPPVLGMIPRNGEVVLHMLENVQQRTIKPILTKTIQLGTTVFTDEYNIYALYWLLQSSARLREVHSQVLFAHTLFHLQTRPKRFIFGHSIVHKQPNTFRLNFLTIDLYDSPLVFEGLIRHNMN
jgi:transposase-like protein